MIWSTSMNDLTVVLCALGEHDLVETSTIRTLREVVATTCTAPLDTQWQLDYTVGLRA